MIFRKFDHLLTTRPHDIHEVFISDLHLEPNSSLMYAFISFLEDLSGLPNLKRLYILGDWFEVWIGDDSYLSLNEEQKSINWLNPIVNLLKKLRIQGCSTFVLTGNRDFLIRQPFCDVFSGKLLTEPYFIYLNNQILRLEHGDALCTDDKNYQRFRKFSHNPIIQWWLLRKPIKKRLAIADKLRSKSKQANANKSSKIMDVNLQSVELAMNTGIESDHVSSVDILIHGHTHRPNIHHLRDGKIRYVLGDWRIKDIGNHEQISAVIGVIMQDKFEMIEYEWLK